MSLGLCLRYSNIEAKDSVNEENFANWKLIKKNLSLLFI